MNGRQRRRRTEDVSGPVTVPGAGPETPTSAPAAPDHANPVAAGAEPAPYPGLAPCYCAEAGTRNCPAHASADDELVLVDERELEQIRWHSYDEAVAQAKAHRDRALEDARARLDRAVRSAYADYGQAVDAVDETYDLARRAALRAHELAGQAS